MNKRQTQGGQYGASLPPDGATCYKLYDQMKIKEKQKEAQKVAMASVGKQGQSDSKTSPKIQK